MPRPSDLSRERKTVNGCKHNIMKFWKLLKSITSGGKKKKEGANTKKRGKTSINF